VIAKICRCAIALQSNLAAVENLKTVWRAYHGPSIWPQAGNAARPGFESMRCLKRLMAQPNMAAGYGEVPT
jgi:hypothetical protein